VQAFLDKRIGFLDIERINEATLNGVKFAPLTDLDMLYDVDQAARRFAEEKIGKLGKA